MRGMDTVRGSAGSWIGNDGNKGTFGISKRHQVNLVNQFSLLVVKMRVMVGTPA